MHDVDVLVLGRSGRPADVGKDVAVKAPTIVESDAGAVSVIAKLGAATDSQGWAHVVVPKSAKADLSTADAQGVADDVPIDRDRAIVLQAGVSTTSVGVPYSLLGPQGRPVVDRTTARVSWGPVDADSVEFQQRVVSVKGFDTGWTRFRGIVEMESRQLAVEYVRGATTCLRAISSLDGVVGPASTPLCRTRPVDDGKLDRVGEWKRPESSQASLGRYSFTKERGARLVLEEVKVSSEAKTGQVTLMVLPTVDGGSIRLRSDGRWISRTHSLAAAGRLGTQPAVGPVPVTVDLLDERAAIRGQVVVVVQTQGLPIRIDGLALPVPLG
jgi:hypothetical protein